MASIPGYTIVYHCLHHLLPSERDTGLDMIVGVEDVLISWFVIMLALLGVASLFVCCMIHCKHLRLSDANKLTYLLTSGSQWTGTGSIIIQILYSCTSTIPIITQLTPQSHTVFTLGVGL